MVKALDCIESILIVAYNDDQSWPFKFEMRALDSDSLLEHLLFGFKVS